MNGFIESIGANMNIVSMIEQNWAENKEIYEERIGRWASQLQSNREIILKAREQFHQREPLIIYTSVAQASKSGSPSFSVRYCGQEIATLKVGKDSNLYLLFSEKHKKTNSRDFGLQANAMTGDKNSFLWNSSAALQIRKHFKKHPQWKTIDNTAREHFLESEVIRLMRKGASSKFSGVLKNIKPVLLYDVLPFQVPVPVSGSKGKPVDSKGNIDILVRRRSNNGRIRLSVWELKKQGKINESVHQSFIYAVTLLKILRSTAGEDWFSLFGFKRSIPARLEIESVVLISETMFKEYERQVKILTDSNPLEIGNDRIHLAVGLYDDKTLKLKSFQEYEHFRYSN